MYAKIAMTTWTLDEPAKSRIQGTDSAFEFEHELGCPMQGSYQDCTCYVSRIRLVKTPVGRTIPTTERDLRPKVRNWQDRAVHFRRETERLQRQNTILAVCLLLSASSGIATTIGFASKLGWL